MKFKIIATLGFFISSASFAKITVVEVANGRAIVEYDKEENLEPKQVLVLKQLSLTSSEQTSAVNNTNSIKLDTVSTQDKVLDSQIVSEYKRTHLVSGSLKSGTQNIKAKYSGSQVKSKSKKTEISGTYYYNMIQYGLGASLNYDYEDNKSDSTRGTSLSLGGRYFIIKNEDKNSIVPYAGISFIIYNEKYSSTSGDIESKLSGANLEVGSYMFLTQRAFVDISYQYKMAKGDLSDDSNYADLDVDQNGLSVGFGITFD